MKFARLSPLFSVLCVIVLFLVACNTEPRQSIEKNRSASSPAVSQIRRERGERLFKQFCANCHPDGGNVSDPARNLHKSTLQANHINGPEDIIGIMRKPISRMLRFDETTLSDEDARAIAVYVWETF